ncbi:hypothetical protein AAFQ97_05965 [Proteus terrae]|uniref:hypothetical protein n=1 Tax=Proteus terrae TaxID=1574161 RepID=UPI003159FA87
MDTASGKLVNPVIEKQIDLNNKKEININNENKVLIKTHEKQSFIIISSYFLITYLISFSLYATNSKHTLLLFSYRVHFSLLSLFSFVIQEYF